MDLATIKDEFNCTRLTKGTQVREDGGVDGDAFALREGEEYVSLNCLSLFDTGDRAEQLALLRRVLRTKLSIRRTHGLSIINVGDVRREGALHGRPLTVRHQPEPDDHTHCGLYGLEYNDEVIQDLIAECVAEVVSAFEPLA